MPEAEIQDIRIRSRMLLMTSYKAEYRFSFHDCRTVYANKGLLSIPYLLKDAVTGNGCKWKPEIE